MFELKYVGKRKRIPNNELLMKRKRIVNEILMTREAKVYVGISFYIHCDFLCALVKYHGMKTTCIKVLPSPASSY